MPRKRGHNEGSYFLLPSGRWRAQVSLDGKRLSVTKDTRQEAIAWIRETLGQIDRGLSIKGANSTVEEFVGEYLRSAAGAKKRRTLEHYQELARNYVIPKLGKIKLKDLRPEHIQNFYNDMTEAGKSAWLVIKVHTLVHQVFRHAAKLGTIPSNPAGRVIVPNPPDEEMKILDDSQVSQLLVACRETRYEALVHLAVTTGMRMGELLGLRWEDVDWVGKSVRIERQLQTNRQLEAPKTRFGRRVVAVGDKTLDVLRRHQKMQDLHRAFAKERWQENRLVFPNYIGAPLNYRTLQRDFKKLLAAAGLPAIRFHDLRHTAAALMLNHGVPVIVVSRRLGHARPSITLDLYGHMIPGLQVEAANLMDSLVTPVEVEL